MRVVFSVLDALPSRHVGADHTPVLVELARAGGGVPGRARSVMTSATYPNHATFATGAAPRDHGIVTNWVPQPGRVVPSWELGPRVPTLFDACRAAGRTSAAVFSDQCLVGVMGAGTADSHWPPDGVPPEEAPLDTHGYVEDDHTLVELCAALDAAPDLVVSQLNGPDTAAHVFGPDSEAALASYRATDALLAEVREHLVWSDTVWILVSDHDQEPVDVRAPIDLRSEFARRGLELFALPEGNATIVCGDGADAARRLVAVDRRRRRDRALPRGRRRARVLPRVGRARSRLRLRRRVHRARDPRWPEGARPGRGRDRWAPEGRAVGQHARVASCQRRRLGPDHRRVVGPRPARRDRSFNALKLARVEIVSCPLDP